MIAIGRTTDGSYRAYRGAVLACAALAMSIGCSSDQPEPSADSAHAAVAPFRYMQRHEQSPMRAQTSKRSDQFSDILLTDQHGKAVRFYTDLVKDKVLMINLMYTTCPKICPANSAHLARVYDHLQPWIGRDITMVSLSIDPDVDTPDRLKRYWEVFGSKPSWLFLTGDYDEIERLRRQLGVYDLDPVIDADKTSHSGIITFGNDRTNRWSALPVLTQAQHMVETILRITWDDRWPGRMGRARPAAPAPAVYRGLGVVRQVDVEHARVVIEHEDIPGFMMAMTMAFEVADRSCLEGLSPDDAVSFRVSSDDGSVRITALEVRRPGGSDAAQRGAEHYAAYCAACHGARGDADGPLAETLDTLPARHSDRASMETLSDDTLFRVIKEGGPAIGKSPQMAAWGENLSDQTIRDLVAYVRTLAN